MTDNKCFYIVCIAKSLNVSEDISGLFNDILASVEIENISTSEKQSSNSKMESQSDSKIRPEIKEAIDSYESFFDDYIDFMKKYKNNPSDLNLLTEYMDYISKLSDMEQKFKAIENQDLTTEETIYYAEVSLRIEKKMLEVLK